MSGIVRHVRESVHEECFASECRRGNCSLKLDGVPLDRLVVDLELLRCGRSLGAAIRGRSPG